LNNGLKGALIPICGKNFGEANKHVAEI
jgi:hypothetical protein